MRIADDDAVVRYWESVRAKARIGRAAAYVGVDGVAAVPPPAISFGTTPEEAEETLERVLAGAKRATSTAVAELGPEDNPPRVGDLWIVLDGNEHPRALIRTASVLTTAFRDVTPEFAALEGDGDGSLEDWRAAREAYYRAELGEGAFSEDMEILCETFEVIDPREPELPALFE